MTAKDQQIYDRHPGLYTAIVYSEQPGKKDGQIVSVKEGIHESLNAEEVRELARGALAKDASSTVFVYSQKEQQYLFWYDCDSVDELLEMTDDDPDAPRMDTRGELAPPALLPRASEPVRPAPRDPDRRPAPAPAEARPVRNLPAKVSRGRKLELGTGGDWPPSEPAQLVKAYFEAGVKVSVKEAVEAIGGKLQALGVEFPAACLSRLKQKGLLREASEE